jgi:lysophospholipase L1-like esterase
MSRYRLTVIGDSFSAGWGDPAPEGGYHGWVGRFSAMAGLQPSSVRNLARYGATTWHAIEHQLPCAVAGKAPLVVASLGANDVLAEHKPYDEALFRQNLHTIFDALTGANTTVITVNYPDVAGNLDISEFARRSLRRRFAEANDAIMEIAEQTGVMCLDVTEAPEWGELAMWDPDRLHPGPHLHQLFAEQVVDLLESIGLLDAA